MNTTITPYGGHDIKRALELAEQPAAVLSCKRTPINGDIGRLMPLAQSDFLQDLHAWIDHLSQSGCPCVVIKRGKQYVLYKERRCRTGSTNPGDKV